MEIEDFIGSLEFQSGKIERRLLSNGTVYATIDPVTSGFKEFVGAEKIPINVPIYNGRNKSLTLDENGFELRAHPLPNINFYNEDEILSKYYENVSNYVKEATGAYKVYCFDHVVRNSGVSMNYSVKGGQKIGGPGLVVHCDYAMKGGPVRMQNFALPPANDDSFLKSHGTRPLISEEEMNELKGRRFAIINLWRSFSSELCVDMPLTMCDTQTTSESDFIAIEFRYIDRVIETYLGAFSPSQKWYYFPEMTKDEALLLKTYDSQGSMWSKYDDYEPFDKNEPAIPSTCTLHSAVKDPRVNEDCPKRESLEVRTIVFF